MRAMAPIGTTFSTPVKAVPPGLTVVGSTSSGVVVDLWIVVGATVGGVVVVVVGAGGGVVVGPPPPPPDVVVVAFFVFVKTHLTVSPAATLKVAMLPVPELLLSLQTMLVRVQPASAVSETVLLPASTSLPSLWPTPRAAVF